MEQYIVSLRLRRDGKHYEKHSFWAGGLLDGPSSILSRWGVFNAVISYQSMAPNCHTRNRLGNWNLKKKCN